MLRQAAKAACYLNALYKSFKFSTNFLSELMDKYLIISVFFK